MLCTISSVSVSQINCFPPPINRLLANDKCFDFGQPRATIRHVLNLEKKKFKTE